MTSVRRSISTLLLCGAVGTAALAQGSPMLNIKLGLWEMTTTMSLAGGAPPSIDTSKMTAEQQAMVAGMMQSKGMAMPPTVAKNCMTKEKLAEHKFMTDRPGQKCQQEVTKSTPATLDMTQNCTIEQPPGQTHSEIHVEAPSQTSLKITGNLTSTAIGRGSQTMSVSATGKWLSADCGDVK